MQIHKSKCCIIVDHPRRDLPGLTLLAEQLANEGLEVYLTPMNLQMEEIVRIQPQLVILTGLRKTTEGMLRFLRSKGLLICALETEGGFFFSDEHMLSKFSNDPELGNLFDYYFSWGEATSRGLRNSLAVKPGQIINTGTPRFDILGDFQEKQPMQILFNTNFAALEEEEFNKTLGMEIFGFDVLPFHKGLRELRDEYVELAKYIEKELNKEVRIVFRPHPFENIDYYREALKGTSIILNTTGGCEEQIAKSFLTIQNNCTTGIESVVAGVPTFSISYISTTYRVPAFESVADFSVSRDELLHKIKSVLSGDYLFNVEDKIKNLKFFIHNIDGTSSVELISKAVLSLQTQLRKTTFSSNDVKKYSYYYPLRQWVYFIRRGKSPDKRKNWNKSNKAFFHNQLKIGKGYKISRCKGLLSVKITKS